MILAFLSTAVLSGLWASALVGFGIAVMEA